MEALLLIDRYRDMDLHATQARQRSDDFWHGFLAQVSAKTPDPFTTLDKLMPELGLFKEDRALAPEKEAELPPPATDQIDDIQAWLAEHQVGEMSGDELPKMNGFHR